MKAVVCPVLLLLSLNLSAVAQSNPAQASPTQNTQPLGETSEEKLKQQAKLQGQVLNQVTGEPVRKANLTLKPEAGGTNLKATTDNEGKFTIENIDPGRYTLSGERQGFVTQNYGSGRASGPGTPIDLKKAQVMKDIAFKITPQGIIAGHILDDDGEPVSGVSVQVLQYKYLLGKKRLMPAVTTLVMSNDLGEFRAPNLAPGRYFVATTPQKLTDIQSGTERSATKTDEGLIPTFYPNAADAASASPVNVGPGAEVRGIDLRLRKARVFRVSGKVMNATTGTPLNPAMIMVYRREAGGMSVFPSSMYMVQGDKGVFELRNLPPGRCWPCPPIPRT
jgi:5-hydroxyisourate hydrolase-like protein (transthyretin family)